jgi:hypothetical protein
MAFHVRTLIHGNQRSLPLHLTGRAADSLAGELTPYPEIKPEIQETHINAEGQIIRKVSHLRSQSRLGNLQQAELNRPQQELHTQVE